MTLRSTASRFLLPGRAPSQGYGGNFAQLASFRDQFQGHLFHLAAGNFCVNPYLSHRFLSFFRAPHHHGHRAVHDPEHEDVESRVADERAGAVQLDHQRVRVPIGGPPQRVLHEVDLDRVEPSADLDDVNDMGFRGRRGRWWDAREQPEGQAGDD